MAFKLQTPEGVAPDTAFVVGWEVDPLFVRWAEAAAEAADAYRFWRRERSNDGYFGYRASADRADAAQDALAARGRGHC